ncbi:Long-chain-fatty-acid--CoA ligase 6 [Schistosoma haematobium]|uniref:Long-chain-fatty-acid--CoA ligase 6 n=1 Tax=Schistosoma haematobium TaxID=6185 RepID=A0A095A474_SCHHA|nr:Long-chain-fatty-acid--CoA ligase 6 [Schistosoma haematobium]KAH9592298.1 Long-chain-fatty-acid--CoA ligase 6 [Schistosoma haematobium]CAH8676687.1 unnamed protein product [Schistosoma haematobium]CAH8679990.1 unnamed protein product [Schistosoma haematobium]
MPRQAELICPEDQTPIRGTCKPADAESHVDCTSLKEVTKKSKHHSKRSSQTTHSDCKEKTLKTKHAKNRNESSVVISPKLSSDVNQPNSADKEGLEKEITLGKNKREHVKKKRKHSKGETRHEKRSKHDEANSEVTVGQSVVKESVRKHKHRDKPHGSPKMSMVDGITHRSTKSVICGDSCRQDAPTSVKEQGFEVVPRSYTYEPVPGTPSSASRCSSHISRSSSFSQSPTRSGKHEMHRVHDPRFHEKLHRQRYEQNSRSPSMHLHHDHKPDLPTRATDSGHGTNPEEKYNSVKRTQSSVSSPSKSKRYNSATLSYGYRQSTQRHHLSPSHRSHSRHHGPHRERSCSGSERYESRRTSTYRAGDKQHIHSKTYLAKAKPRYHNPDDNPDLHEISYSKNYERRHIRDSNSTKRHESESHRRETIESLSPSPKISKQLRENYEPQHHSTRQQVNNLLKSQSDIHPPLLPKRDRRSTNEVHDSCSPSRKSTNSIPVCTESAHHPSSSPSHPPCFLPKDKDRKLQTSHALCELLDGLKCEDVSDTELHLIIPPSMINTMSSDTSLGCNNELTCKAELSVKNNRDGTYNSNDNNNSSNNANSNHLAGEKVEKNESTHQNRLNNNINLDSLEVLSTQIRQHMTGPENWDINDLADPIELGEEYSENTTDQANSDLLNSEKSNDSLYTPWQELIESAGQKLSLDATKSDEQDYVQCVGNFIAGIGHQDIISLRGRANGIDVLRRTGVSRTYFDSDLLMHLSTNTSSNEQSGEILCQTVEFPDTWAKANCGNSLTGSGILNQLSKLVLPLSRKTDGYLRQGLLKIIKCT